MVCYMNMIAGVNNTVASVQSVAESEAMRIGEEFTGLCGHLNVLHARMVMLVAEALVSEAWAGWGLRSPEHWLCWQTGVSPSRAQRIVSIARRVDDLPVTMAAFAKGVLSIDQVAVIAAHARAFNDAEACELARSASVAQLSAVLSRYRFADGSRGYAPKPAVTPEQSTSGYAAEDTASTTADSASDDDAAANPASPAPTDTAPDPKMAARETAAAEPGWLSHGYNDDGRYSMHLNAPADLGAVIEAALAEAHDRLFRERDGDVTWLDALADVCARSLAAIASPSRSDLYRIYVHLDTEGAWLNTGPALPKTLIDKILCDGYVRPLWHSAGTPINVGDSTRVIPINTRRVVKDRDRVCRFPGCHNTHRLELHHIIGWHSDHGPTNTSNLIALCPKHHAMRHQSMYTITGNADQVDGVIFRRRDHSTISATAAPAPPGNQAPPAPSNGFSYQHPSGEPLHQDCIMLREPPTPNEQAA